ncbi:MAG: ribonuclease P protein component [Pseudomonadota bacterium]|nr:ribonuclease P protein component [Pseudomonadota bacterium]
MDERSMQRLRKRRDFVRVSKNGGKVGGRFFSLQVASVDPGSKDTSVCRVGFTATKKVGNAVERNRARRRMRVLATRVLSGYAMRDLDCVLLARKPILEAQFSELVHDLQNLLEKLKIKARPSRGGVMKVSR